MSKFTERKGAIRLYDGTGTPFYLELILSSGFNGPIGAPKTEEILVLNRGEMDAYAHYIEGPDDKLLEPFAVSFSVLLEDSTATTYLLDWLDGNTVNSNTIVTTKQDTQRDGSNNNPAFADSGKLCCNVEYFLDNAVDICWHYNEVYFDLNGQNFAEAEDGVPLSLNGMCYGTVTRDTEFTTGTSVKA